MDNKKRINISQKYKFYLLGLAAFLMLSFIVFSVFIVKYKVKQDKVILREKIYADKQKHIESQVLSAIGTIKTLRDDIELKMRQDLKNRVDEAYDVAMNLYNVNKNLYSDEQIKHIIIEALRTPRFFNGRGYYFINKDDGLSLLHPIDRSIENRYGKNLNSLFAKKLKKQDAAYFDYD